MARPRKHGKRPPRHSYDTKFAVQENDGAQMTENDGGRDRGRTGDLIVANDALSQLSYSPSVFAANQYIFQQPLEQPWVNQTALICVCLQVAQPLLCVICG